MNVAMMNHDASVSEICKLLAAVVNGLPASLILQRVLELSHTGRATVLAVETN